MRTRNTQIESSERKLRKQQLNIKTAVVLLLNK